MSAVSLEPGSHLGVVKPDSRFRFPLAKWLSRQPNDGWRVFRLDDGKTIVLQAIA